MLETANGRGVPASHVRFHAGIDEMHDLQNEYVTRALEMNRDVSPATFEIMMANAAAIGRRIESLGVGA